MVWFHWAAVGQVHGCLRDVSAGLCGQPWAGSKLVCTCSLAASNQRVRAMFAK